MNKSFFNFTRKELLMIVVAALGYFVDIYDLLIFSSERVESLQAIGVATNNMKDVTLMLQNYQMTGLIIGGVFGVLADKFGRVRVLFASIILYSIANITNAFVTNVSTFAFVRFVAGLGLAGELGIALSWISESLKRGQRTIATMIVSAIGLCGGITAAIVASKFNWQTSYIAGGVMGLLLLFFRISINESKLYNQIRNENVKRGNLIQLLRNKSQIAKFVLCILSGAPAFVFMSIYVTLSPEFSAEFNISEKASVSNAIMVYLIAFTVSDILCGFLSKILEKRKTPLIIYAIIQTFAVSFFLLIPPGNVTDFYLRCTFLGFSVGYWGILITNSLEQFGTNIRATVATSTSNLIRGITIPASLVFLLMSKNHGIITSGIIIGFLLIAISMVSIFFLKDNFENDLNFTE
jgi:MFS transporter, putative metabolite:H+ symporter